MERFVVPAIALMVGFFIGSGHQVEKKGQTSKIILEHDVQGHLTELNGKYKLRVSETVYDPGGFIGVHHHAGPGIRLIEEGELRYVQPDKTTIYKKGDAFFESGDVTHTAYNDGKTPVRLLNFELLPVTWQGPSTYPPPQK